MGIANRYSKMRFVQKLIGSKEVKNASWIILGRIIQMVLSFFVGILTARYLGPSNYGLISYCTSYIAFFSSLCTLGINSIIVKELIDEPNNQGETIGSTLVLRAVSSFLSGLMVVGIVTIIDHGEPLTLVVTILCSLSLLFQVFDTINFWFQSKYKSKATAVVALIAYVCVSAYKIILLAQKKSVEWFAFASAVDTILVAILLLFIYFRSGGQALSFSWARSKVLLKKGYHYVISGMMVAIYSQTDRFMLKQMVNESEVGYYTIAVTISTMWAFVLSAIIDSMYPTIVRLYSENKDAFDRKNTQLYSIVFYTSCIVSILFILFGDFFVPLLYGAEYSQSVLPLKIVTWYVAFSYLGVARNPWIVCTNNQRHLKFMYFIAVPMNIILNYIFIPIMKSSGAALASLITQVFTSIVLPLFITDMRPNAKLMINAITLRGVFSFKR